jgi:hypothetical protein
MLRSFQQEQAQMDATPRLQLPYIAPQQAQKQVTYNHAMRALDQLVQPAVKSRSIATPPENPAEGDTYVVGPAATGAWASQEGKLASLFDGAWSFRAPADGWQLYVEDSAEIVIRQAGAWESFVTNGGTAVAKFGVNAAADVINRLAVASEASLFDHDGADHRLTLNKAAASDTGSVLFKTGFSGRTELGLTGDDNFHVKVSPDGATWFEALTVARSSGLVSLPLGQLAFPAVQNASADPHTLDDYEEGSWTPGVTFGGTAVGVTYGSLNLGRYTKIGRLCVATGTLHLTNKGSSSGLAVLAGLPFASPNTGLWTSCAIGYAASTTSVVGSVLGLQVFNDNKVHLFHSNNGNATQLSNTNFTNGTQLHVTVAYEVA